VNPAFLSCLVDPVSGAPLTHEATRPNEDDVKEGRLVSSRAAYPIVGGVPRFYQSTHDAAEARRWLRESSLAAVPRTASEATAYCGIRAPVGIPTGA
jgi:uncharacterized protein YbaR (Trm112 family)